MLAPSKARPAESRTCCLARLRLKEIAPRPPRFVDVGQKRSPARAAPRLFVVGRLRAPHSRRHDKFPTPDRSRLATPSDCSPPLYAVRRTPDRTYPFSKAGYPAATAPARTLARGPRIV